MTYNIPFGVCHFARPRVERGLVRQVNLEIGWSKWSHECLLQSVRSELSKHVALKRLKPSTSEWNWRGHTGDFSKNP